MIVLPVAVRASERVARVGSRARRLAVSAGVGALVDAVSARVAVVVSARAVLESAASCEDEREQDEVNDDGESSCGQFRPISLSSIRLAEGHCEIRDD